jgi:ribonuclease G
VEREILCEVYPWESRVAIVEDGRLAEVFWANQDERVGNIYKGKVKDIIAGLSCAFIDIGLSKNAFLYAGDVCCPEEKRGCNLFDLLKTGQDIMVQVKKEAFSEKGARVTGNLSLPGQFLVLLPYQREICISRKITDSKLRDRLKEIVDANKPECMGVIIRTACLQADENEIAAEMERLMMVWNDINRRYENSRAPSLLYEDMDVLERTLRDYIDKDVSRILVNNPKLKEKIMDCITERKSPIVPVLYEKGELFEKYGLEKDIKRALRRKVWLKSGGYLIFDETEAISIIRFWFRVNLSIKAGPRPCSQPFSTSRALACKMGPAFFSRASAMDSKAWFFWSVGAVARNRAATRAFFPRSKSISCKLPFIILSPLPLMIDSRPIGYCGG